MIDHSLVHLALRSRLLTLVVCTTGSTSLESTATGYSRSSGSFVDDGFAVGMEVEPTGFPQTDHGVITEVTAGSLRIDGGRAVHAAAVGRTLTVGVPELAAWENVQFVPEGKRPYLAESYIPAPPTLRSFPAAGGLVEEFGAYQVQWYGRENVDMVALNRQSSAVIELFKFGTVLSLSDGYAVRVLEQGPYRGAVRNDEPGWAVVVITIPWRLFHIN